MQKFNVLFYLTDEIETIFEDKDEDKLHAILLRHLNNNTLNEYTSQFLTKFGNINKNKQKEYFSFFFNTIDKNFHIDSWIPTGLTKQIEHALSFHNFTLTSFIMEIKSIRKSFSLEELQLLAETGASYHSNNITYYSLKELTERGFNINCLNLMPNISRHVTSYLNENHKIDFEKDTQYFTWINNEVLPFYKNIEQFKTKTFILLFYALNISQNESILSYGKLNIFKNDDNTHTKLKNEINFFNNEIIKLKNDISYDYWDNPNILNNIKQTLINKNMADLNLQLIDQKFITQILKNKLQSELPSNKKITLVKKI